MESPQEIIEYAKRLYQRNMLAAADGNLSLRLSNGNILITPSGRAKAFISPSEMAEITLSGETVSGHPSGEKWLHLAIYNHVPHAKAVIHAHPPTAIAWSVAHPELKELPSDCLSEVILALGRVPIVPYARPGTHDMGDVLLPHLPECHALIMARHGAVTWGSSLEEAYFAMERIEHISQILLSAKSLGGLTSLPREELDYLWACRKEIGDRVL
jgi:L-fuculose-phosphate aldolase